MNRGVTGRNVALVVGAAFVLVTLVLGLTGQLDDPTEEVTTDAAPTSITETTVDEPEPTMTTSTTAHDPGPATITSAVAAEPVVDPLAGCNVDVNGGDWLADLDPACVASFPWDSDEDQPLLICRGDTGVAVLNLNRFPEDDLVMPVNDAAREAMTASELVLDDVSVAVPLDLDPSVIATLANAADWLCMGALGCYGIDEFVYVYAPGERPSWNRTPDGTVVCEVVPG